MEQEFVVSTNQGMTESYHSDYAEVLDALEGRADASELFDKLDELEAGEEAGLELFDAPRLTELINGQRLGDLNYLVFSSGVGKSSFITEKAILSLLINEEKGIIFANEEGIKRWRTRVLATVASRILKKPIARDEIGRGKWKDPNVKKILLEANDWLQTHRPDHIKFIQLKKYRIEDVINRIELYRAKGYKYIYFDTFKPDQSQPNMDRWLSFSNKMVEAAEEMAKEIRRRIEKTEQNPNIAETNGTRLIKNKIFGDLEMVAALRYYIELAAQRREERDSNQRLHIQSLEEIDRLNAENESLRQTLARYFGAAKTVQEYEQAEDTLRDELDELKERLAIRTNTAQKSLEAAHAEVNRRAAREEEASKEIERLRAEMQSSADDLRELMEVAYRDCPYEAQKIADRLVVALKGAE